MTVRIQLRRDSASNWTSNNPILQAGELGYDTTNSRFKVGIASDNTSRWNALPYLNVLPTELTELAQDALKAAFDAGTHSNISVNFDDATNKITLSTTANVVLLDSNNLILDSQIPSGITRDSELQSHEQDTTNIHGIADTAQLATKTYADNAATTAVAAVIDSAPSALNTLKELATALNNDASYASTITTALGTKLDSTTAASTYAPIASPTFTGTVGGITKGMVGLGNVDNTSDMNKPISVDTAAALDGLSNTIATKANNLSSVYTVSDTTFNITQDYLFNRVEFTSSSAVTITIPNDITENLSVGSNIELLQAGTGKLTIVGANGVSIYGPDNQFKSRVQWSSIFIEKRAANSWLITGDTEA